MKEGGYDGTPIRWMSTKEYFYNYNAGVVFKQQLEAVGFKVDLQVMDWATLVKRRSDSKEYDIFVTAHESYVHPVLQPFMGDIWPGWWTLPARRTRSRRRSWPRPTRRSRWRYIKELQRLFYTDVPGVKYGEYFVLRARSNKVMGTDQPVRSVLLERLARLSRQPQIGVTGAIRSCRLPPPIRIWEA